MHREVQFGQGPQQGLDGIGQHNGAGGIGQQAGARNQGRHPDPHDDGIPDALGVDGDKAHLEQRFPFPADKEDIQHGGEQDDGQDGLQAAADHLEGDPGDLVHGPQEHHRQSQPQGVGSGEQHRNIDDGKHQFQPGVKAVDQAVAGEVLSNGNITNHWAPPPFSSLRGRVRLSPASRRALASRIFFTA